MNSPDDAQIFSDVATFLIGLGTLGCLVWPPQFVGNLLNLRVVGRRRNRSRAFATMLFMGIVFSALAIAARGDAKYFLGVAGLAVFLGVVLTLQVVFSNVIDGAFWWIVQRFKRQREPKDDLDAPRAKDDPEVPLTEEESR